MKKISLSEAQRMSAPASFALLTTGNEDGSTNLMAVSWWTYLSNRPPRLGAALGNKSLSGENIRRTGEFALCVVDEELRDAALKCGCCSGKSVNKADEFGIALESAESIAPETVRASRIVFECRLCDTVDICDSSKLYIADIVAIRGDESKTALFAYDVYARLGTAAEG